MPYKDPEKHRRYHKAYSQAYNATTKAKEKKKQYDNSPEGRAVLAARKATPEWKKMHARAIRKWALKKMGWTVEMAEQTRLEQGNACAICRKVFVKTPHKDHEHIIPPKPRGLLCPSCNKGLGHFFENPEALRAAANYVEDWR